MKVYLSALLMMAVALYALLQPPRTVSGLVGGRAMVLEVADTEAKRQRGLSGREVMAVGRGMLFVFPDERRRCFWMRGTPVPLSIAFFDPAGVLLSVAEMAAESEGLTCADGVGFAVEAAAGTFVSLRSGARLQVAGYAS